MLEYQLDTNRDYELTQAFLNILLKYHTDSITNNEELVQLIRSLKTTQRESWLRLQSMFHNSLCLVRFFSGIQS